VGAGVLLIRQLTMGRLPSFIMVRAERILMSMPLGMNTLTKGTMNWNL
jgi:hypothetical protein